jgi:hypothetical protein
VNKIKWLNNGDSMVSSRDYQKFAKMLAAEAKVEIGYTWLRLQAAIADIFAQNNPKFDRKRFDVACRGQVVAKGTSHEKTKQS